MAKPTQNLKGIAALLAKQGRNGDTMLAHINPQEAALLKSLGGAGTINPDTGLPEYWSWRNLNPFAEDNILGGLNPGSSTFIAKPVIDTAREITGGTAEAIQNVASKLGTTVENVVSDPRKLAAVAVMVAFPGAAASVGDFLLPEAAAAALGPAGTAVVGQTAINTAFNGGDLNAAVKAALVQQGLPAITNAAATSQLGKDIQDVLGKYGAQATTQAGLAAIMGKDPVAAFVFSGASSAAGLITKDIPGFADMPPSAQNAINSAVTAKLTGKDAATAAANSLVATALQTAKHAVNVQDTAIKATGRVLDEQSLAAAENISPEQAVKAITLSSTYGRNFIDIAKAMGVQDEVPEPLKALEDTYQAVFKKVGNDLYTFAGGNSPYGLNWVLDKNGDPARINGAMIFYDADKDTLQTSAGVVVDPDTMKEVPLGGIESADTTIDKQRNDTTGGGEAADDGTTAGIQDLISQTPVTPPTGIETLPPSQADYAAADQTQTQTNLQDPFAYTPPEEPGLPALVTPPTPETPMDDDIFDTSGLQNLYGGELSPEDITAGFDTSAEDFDLNEATSDLQDVYGGNLSTEDIAAGLGGTEDLWSSLSKFTGLTPNTLKLFGAGLGGLGIGSLLGGQQNAPTPTPYTGPLSQTQYNPATYTPYTYKPFAGGGAVEQMSNANAIGANTGYPMADIQRGAYATPYQQPVSQNVITGPQDTRVDPYTGEELLAGGGIASLGSYSDGGRLLRGPGDGVSDSIPAVIGDGQPARLADGEFVIPARIVSELGNGSTDAGARKLYAMMDRIQAARRKTTGKEQVAKNTRAEKYLPT